MKQFVWAVLAAGLVLASCSQPLEGTGLGSDLDASTVPGITSFSLAGVTGEIAGTIIYVRDVPLYTAEQTLTNLRNAVPVIKYTGPALEPDPATPRDFTTPQIYGLLTEDGLRLDYTVVVTLRPLTSIDEIRTYLPIAAGVYDGTPENPIPLPVGLELSAVNWQGILNTVQGEGKYVALDLSACTASTDTAGGGLYGSRTFDPGLGYTGESKIVSLVLPEEAEKIAAGFASAFTFRRFTTLGSVTGAEVKEVGDYTFGGCDALTMVSFPMAATIGFDAFSGCALTMVNLPSARTIGEAAFSSCDALNSINLPAATTIGSYAFSGCDDLISINLPAAATIFNEAFSGCVSLETVSLPAAVIIGSYAFANCNGLTMVSFPAVTTLETYVFSGCVSLETVSLPAATSIGSNAFADCDNLTTVTLPTVRTLGSNAFADCDNLSWVSFPAATSIGIGAFTECDNLTTVILPAARTIDGNAFYNCVTLSSVDLPRATVIRGNAFYNCAALSMLSLPAVITINQNAFGNCENLREVNLPAAITLDSSVFSGCSSLSTVSLPAVTAIGVNAFLSTGTGELTVTLGAAPPRLARFFFNNLGSPKNVTIKVPDTSAYGTPLSVSGVDNTPCWANGFRGGGWDGYGFDNMGTVNRNINLTIQTY
jgi:hypothetical protein